MRLRHKKLFWGIREKISLCYIAAAIMIIILTNLAVYRIYQNDIVEKEFVYMEDENRILADNIGNMLSRIEEKLVSELEYCTVFSYQDDLSNLYVADVERSLKSLATLMKMRGTNVKGIYVLDQYVCSYYYDVEEARELEDFRKQRIYREIRGNYKTMFPRQGSSLWRCFPEQSDEIYLIKHYIDSKTTDYKGVVCLIFDKSYLETLLGEHEFSSMIYDEMGSLLYCSEDLDGVQYETGEEMREQYLVTSTIVGRKGWKLMALVDKKEILLRTRSMTRTLVAVELVILIGAVLISTYLFQRMLKNIIALSDRFRDINAGKPVTSIPVRTGDETAYLCRQFNEMYRELKLSVEKMAHDSTLRERAEYNALLAQMNPHFLYNTLESISSMARLSGQEEIVRTIHMLGYLLRVSYSGITQKIPLREELRYIRYYLELQKLVTGGDRLEWDISVEAGAEDYLVPKLLLQPVVENAIIHGLRSVSREGIIVINANSRDDCLIIDVDDNGEGARQEEIDRILAQEEPDRPGQDRAHIGIRSIQKRIHILYGPRYGMEMKSAPGDGMMVRITLPLEKEEACESTH